MPPYVLITRHGETPANLEKYLQSQTIDEPLNAFGRMQAKNLGVQLKDKRIGLMVISPSKRTMETANFIMDAIAPPHVADVINPDFLEINCGSLDGMFYAEIKKEYPALFNAWWGSAHPFAKHKYPFPDGESCNQIVYRGKSAAKYLLSEIAARPDQNILVVGHGSMNSVIIAILLGINPEVFFGATYFDNCGLVKIDINHFDSGRARLIIT